MFKQLFCKHTDLSKIRTIMSYDTYGRLTLYRTKYKCNKCGKVIIKKGGQ